ncbi:glycoside hydrolase family 18 protein [Boletus edulis]|nr:glycoside hydrolase family 18 protein [Boletus edulis]
MVLLLRFGVTAVLTTFSLLGSTQAQADRLVDKLRSLSPGARDLLKGFTPATSRFMVYDDTRVSSLPKAEDLQGYNVYALSFWRTIGPCDLALEWQGFTNNERISYLNEYNSAGISIIVAAFGDSEQPTTAKADPVTVADDLANWVVKYGLHGVDIDYEDFAAFFNSKAVTAEPWLISLTQQLRVNLPQGDYILTHAPVAPWFSPNVWIGGGYLHVDQTVGYLIDWYNVQFYNQGETEFTTCTSLLHQSSSHWPESALFQIVAHGVDPGKLVIGKPARPEDVHSGYMSPKDLHSCIQEAHAAGWDAGVMGWKYPYASSTWINTVRGNTI